jgi:hypothetical protein
MHYPTRCLVAAAALTIQACVDTSFEAKDTWTILSPTTRDMSVIGANWLPSAEQVLAAREAARQRIAQDAKALPPVGRNEWRLRDARDILQHWNSYRLQAWGYTKHHKKLIRLSFLTMDQMRDTDWRHELVVLSDGGSAFWQADYDPASGKILWWEANAVA